MEGLERIRGQVRGGTASAHHEDAAGAEKGSRTETVSRLSRRGRCSACGEALHSGYGSETLTISVIRYAGTVGNASVRSYVKLTFIVNKRLTSRYLCGILCAAVNDSR